MNIQKIPATEAYVAMLARGMKPAREVALFVDLTRPPVDRLSAAMHAELVEACAPDEPRIGMVCFDPAGDIVHWIVDAYDEEGMVWVREAMTNIESGHTPILLLPAGPKRHDFVADVQGLFMLDFTDMERPQ